MVKRLLTLLLLLPTACTVEYDLDMRDMGNSPGYFVECYCVPGEMFDLTATRIAPIAEDQILDYSLEFETWIRTDERFRLWHSLFHDGKIIYNYASDRRLDTSRTDSIWLDMTAPDGLKITAATAIPPQVALESATIVDNRLEVRFQPQSGEENPLQRGIDRCYILSVNYWGDGKILDDTRVFHNHNDEPSATLTCEIPDQELLKAPIDSIVVELKRMTREGYQYQLSVREAQNANRDPLIQPPPLQGNIAGALGVFTCYTRDRQTLYLQSDHHPSR